MLEEKEEWRPVVGYEGLYEVSNLGNVRSLHSRWKEPHLMTSSLDKYGYPTVSLRNGEVYCKHGKVHRMVAQAFIPNPNNYKEINHKDENKENNVVDNLEWCDTKYNINYGSRTQKVADKLKNGPKSKPVIATCYDGTEEYYPSTHEASRQLSGLDVKNKRGGNISGAIQQKYGCKTAFGRRWRFATEEEIEEHTSRAE